MHIPYVSSRHGEAAFRIEYDKLKKNFDNGELLQVADGTRVVAAVLIDYKFMRTMPRMTRLGVLNGDLTYVKKGAINALYFYTMQYLKEGGHKQVSLGSTRPFLNDGILRYKLNWGARIVCDSRHAFLLALFSQNKCLKSYLLQNPFIVNDRKKLILVKCRDENADVCQDVLLDDNKIRMCGLEQILKVSI
jgi:hypothetical protein